MTTQNEHFTHAYYVANADRVYAYAATHGRAYVLDPDGSGEVFITISVPQQGTVDGLEHATTVCRRHLARVIAKQTQLPQWKASEHEHLGGRADALRALLQELLDHA